jgi:hypothetical protein
MSAAEKFAFLNHQIQITQELITPERAKEYLKLNNHNRPLSRPVVEKYAEQMRRGLWQFNGDPIRLTHDGIVVDGQHRLEAVVLAGVPLRAVVVRGVDISAFQTIDVGKKRGANDMLSIAGYTATNGLAAGARLLLVYESGAYWAEEFSRVDRDPTGQRIVDYVVANPDVVDAWKEIQVNYQQVVKLLSPSISIFALTLASRHDRSKAREFMAALESGVSSDDSDPRHMLREAVIKYRIQAKRPMRQEECAAITVKSMNAYFTGAQIKALRYRTRGPKAEKFPKFSPV